ncbi:MAG: AAA family ATPase [Clostridiales bacterium]|nr:AAA family ATPase [Clostridiales bacterium]
MRPILLKIKGLNSFISQQCIDFERLTKYGFFGIFGPTGSGKSTIIDAVTLALYGKVSRYDEIAGLGQFINMNADSAYVYFEFGISGEIYVVERKYELNKGRAKNSLARVYIKNGVENKILEEGAKKVDVKIKNILGIGYDDFERAIVLPQGRFSDFLLLDSKGRREMLGRIFNLEKYGEAFYKGFSKSFSGYNNLLINIEGKLNIFKDVSEKNIQQLESGLNQKAIDIKQISGELADANKLLAELKGLQKDNNELLSYLEIKKGLSDRQLYIDGVTQKLILAKNALSVKPLIEENNNLHKILDDKNGGYSRLIDRLNSCIEKENYYNSEYEAAKNNKDEKLPKLQNYCGKLKQVIDLNNIIDSLKKNRALLRGQYASKKQECENAASQLESAKNNLAGLRLESKKLATQREALYIAPEYRGQVIKGSRLSSELLALNQEQGLLLSKKASAERNLAGCSLSLGALDKSVAQEKQTLGGINIELEKIEEPDINKLELLTTRLTILKNGYEQKKASFIKGQELIKNIELAKAEINRLLKLKENYGLKQPDMELEALNIEIFGYERDKALSIIVNGLKEGGICPVCGSLIKGGRHLEIEPEGLTGLLNKKNILEKQISLLKDEYKKIDIEYEIKVMGLENLIKQSEGAIISEAEIKKLELEINIFETQYNNKKLEYKNNAALIKKLTNEKARLSDNINLLEKKRAKLNADSEMLLNSINDINEGINKSRLKAKQIEAELKALPIDGGFNELSQKILDMDMGIRKIVEQENKLNKDLDKGEKSLLEIEKNKNILSAEFEEIKNQGMKINYEVSSNEDILSRLPKIENPEAELEAAEKDAGAIIENEKNIKSSLNKILEDKQRLLNDKTTLTAQIGMYSAQAGEASQKLKSGLEFYGFYNIEEAEKNYIPETYINGYEIEAAKFNDDLRKNNENISRLEKLLLGKETEGLDARILSLENEIHQLNDTYVELNKTVAVLNSDINKMRGDLEKVSSLNKEKAEIIHKIDLYKDLSDVFRGNKFVEYLAKKQLNYITAEASNRLRAMSKGRYAIELDDSFDSAEFIIRDDFNGGVRRLPQTLSGGETFIVSLCLALALSSRIQMGSRSPLEFFFLDEGFGTLDKKSLDSVVGCLMDLRGENLVIGVISHSDELKERVALRVIVEPPKQFESGSQVKLESYI